MSTFDKLKAVIEEQLLLDNNTVKPESTFREDLACDSLDAVELAMAVEEAFGIGIPNEEFEPIKTVAEAVALIDRKLK